MINQFSIVNDEPLKLLTIRVKHLHQLTRINSGNNAQLRAAQVWLQQ